MAIKGIFVTNISHNSPKFRIQVDEFLNKAKLIPNLELIEVKNQHVLSYLNNNTPDFCLFWDKDIYLAKRIENSGIKVLIILKQFISVTTRLVAELAMY